MTPFNVNANVNATVPFDTRVAPVNANATVPIDTVVAPVKVNTNATVPVNTVVAPTNVNVVANTTALIDTIDRKANLND